MDHPTIELEANRATWQPLTPRQRRVLGTLMEKSKTTPESYPLTFLALTTGCNQKSNRFPVNNYSQDQIEETVDFLKGIGAAALVLGNGRVPKVRHYAYQWMGISKVEAAVLTELLLRGEQTVGELRTRATRMEPIADLAELQRLLSDLHQRHLVLFLSPAGRGQIVSHNLYPEPEKAALQQKYAGHVPDLPVEESEIATSAGEPGDAPPIPLRESTPARPSLATSDELAEFRRIVSSLQDRVRVLEELLDIAPPTEPT